jgi:hypothetical protein
VLRIALLVTPLLFMQPAPEPVDAAALLESLLFGFSTPPGTRTLGLPADAQQALAAYRQRELLFEPKAPAPGTSSGVEDSLHVKRVGMERALFSLFPRDDAAQLAAEYVKGAALAYEWEGFPEVPLGEAQSADTFLARQPNSPLVPYALLFAGHRKACAAEIMRGFNDDDPRAREIQSAADIQLLDARDSDHPLIREVASYIIRTRRCFER